MKRGIPFMFLFVIASMVSCNQDKPAASETPESSDPKISKLKLPLGFKAERLYSPGEMDQGSWVSMTFDDKGRIIACDQYGSLYRVTVPPVGDTSKAKVEKLIVGEENLKNQDTSNHKIGMGYAQGLLYAFNSLYVMVNYEMSDPWQEGSGLYRLQDIDGDDQYEKVSILKALKGAGEHGPHSIKLSPDKNSLYLICGNHTDVPEMNNYRLPSNWKEDNLFPLIKDPSGHANSRYAPGGWIAHIDSLGRNWELFSAGFRNAFDIAFNDAGDLFAYDSDMEYDIGMPWYRPTRVCHVTSGSEFGWRTGNSKWSPSYPDDLPAVLNVGQGSPTNLIYTKDAKFPDKYRQSLLAFDWSFGIIYAIHLKPQGASYSTEAEEFISGAPLPLTDGVIGPDGALYFLTGGRRLDSDLYRVSYEGDEKQSDNISPVITDENKLRRQIEEYHIAPKAGAVAFVWPYLKHDDRFIRYAARVALEHQPVAEWEGLVLKEKDPVTLIQSAVALARQGKPAVKDQLLKSLNAVNYDQLSGPQQIDILRAYELIFLRMGMPSGTVKEQTIVHLDEKFPAKENYVNRQLSKILISLQAPKAVEKTMALMENAKDGDSDQKMFMESSDLILRNPQYGTDIAKMLSKVPPAQQTYYANMLSAAKTGWTPELQEKYFSWFANSFKYQGGKSFKGFVDKARKMALENVAQDKLAYFNAVSGDSMFSRPASFMQSGIAIQPKGPGRNWKSEEAEKIIDSGLVNRSFEQGKAMYAASFCSSCHSIQGEGANIGPDLTQLGTRFSARDIVQSIIEPSKTISDQYASTVFDLKNGRSVTGRLINQDDTKYYVSQNPFAPQSIREILKVEVMGKRLSQVSVMLPETVNRLNPEELKDLIAYLVAGGNKEHPIYTGKK